MGRLVRIVEDGYHNLYSAYQENLGEIPVKTEETDLVYDFETKVVYYMFKEYGGITGSLAPRPMYIGYLSPYISENGKYCRFIDGKLVEIG